MSSSKQRARRAWEFSWDEPPFLPERSQPAQALLKASTSVGQIASPPCTGQVVQLDTRRSAARTQAASLSSAPTFKPGSKSGATHAWDFKWPRQDLHRDADAIVDSVPMPAASSSGGKVLSRRISNDIIRQRVRSRYANPPAIRGQHDLTPDGALPMSAGSLQADINSSSDRALHEGRVQNVDVGNVPADHDAPRVSGAVSRAGPSVHPRKRPDIHAFPSAGDRTVEMLSLRVGELESMLAQKASSRKQFSAREMGLQNVIAERDGFLQAARARIHELEARLQDELQDRAETERRFVELTSSEDRERLAREAVESRLADVEGKLATALIVPVPSSVGVTFPSSDATGHHALSEPLDARRVFERFGQSGIKTAGEDVTEERTPSIRRIGRELISVAGLKPGSPERVVEVVRRDSGERRVLITGSSTGASPSRVATSASTMSRSRLTLGSSFRSNPEQILQRVEGVELRRREDGTSAATGSISSALTEISHADPAASEEEKEQRIARARLRIAHDPLVREAARAVALIGQMQGKPDIARRATDSLATLRRLLSGLEMKAMGIMGALPFAQEAG